MSTYNEFSIQAVIPDLPNRQIIIKTNFKVDPSSVDMKSVAYYDYDNAKLAVYKLEVETKNIYIKLNEYPSSGSRYYLKISGIKDALGRKLATNFDDYIKFTESVTTKVQIISPTSRETYKDRTVVIRLKISEVMNDLSYRIEISTDNVFYNKITTLLCKVPNEFLNIKDTQFFLVNDDILANQDGVAITFNNGLFLNDELELNTTIEREGQLYIRARAELNEITVGDWSEIISFNIYTVSMDSIETNFLEDYLTSNDLFEDSILEPIEVVDRSEPATNEGAFFIEFNKDIKIPEKYVLNKDGYIKLGTIVCTRKEVK